MRKKPWTSLELVKTAADFLAGKGIEGARLDAELLLAHVLECERMALYTQFEKPLETKEVDAYRELIRQRADRHPVKYLIGRCEFASLEFEVNRSVLIPRPETEFVVTAALECVAELARAQPEPVVIDLGTGSGNIAAALAMTLPSGKVFAGDISSDAAATAERNVKRHGLDGRVVVRCGDLFGPFADVPPADVVVSNPPYIVNRDFETLQPEVRLYEPEVALKGGEDGLDLYRRIAVECRPHLKPGGALVLEIGQGQRHDVEGILCAGGAFEVAHVVNDYSDIERVIVAKHRARETGVN